jgi:3-phosphoshikimate 1-carboxyvinyltransferase
VTSSLKLKPKKSLAGTAELLPASKSISNRVLIMNALAGSDATLRNLSDANDTQLMLRLVRSAETLIDVEDAGTTMRFLTAYFALTNQEKIITGTDRMKERPIGILVDALRTLGAEINYENVNGYPPLHIEKFTGQKTDSVTIRGDVSSQFISALMMVGPLLPQGLRLRLTGKIGSRPYIEMTASLMNQFGVSVDFTGNEITIKPQKYKPTEFTVESDWSAASYWFGFTALAEVAEIFLPRISLSSLQGDRTIVDIMKHLGVRAEVSGDKLKLTKTPHEKHITWDFTHCPDLAQTVAVVCAAKGIEGTLTGLESLRIKETDRISALQKELEKIGGRFVEESGAWKVIPSRQLPEYASIETYKDHRMAMAFAPLATMMELEIKNPAVVKKSYPRFWDDLKNLGFTIEAS